MNHIITLDEAIIALNKEIVLASSVDARNHRSKYLKCFVIGENGGVGETLVTLLKYKVEYKDPNIKKKMNFSILKMLLKLITIVLYRRFV